MGTVREVMSPTPVTLPSTASLLAAARLMAERGIGDVLVVDDDRLVGVLTDRDLVVRGMATGMAPDAEVRTVCSTDVVTVGPDDELSSAIRLLKDHAVRRLPVVDDSTVVGIVSLGDLAVERDAQSALGVISRAPSNH